MNITDEHQIKWLVDFRGCDGDRFKLNALAVHNTFQAGHHPENEAGQTSFINECWHGQ